jgi:hypothetical protein
VGFNGPGLPKAMASPAAVWARMDPNREQKVECQIECKIFSDIIVRIYGRQDARKDAR